MKKYIKFLVAICLFFSCKKQNEHLPPDFNYKIEPVAISENVNVGAYYYNYSAADWTKKYTNEPEIGEYSALDPLVMEQHRQWADLGGVDFFIFNWNGTSGNALLDNFVAGRKNKVKMVINYNVAHLSATNASPLVGAKLNTMITELKALATNHLSKDYYFNIGNQPVILITPLNLSASLAASIDFSTVIPAVKQALDEVGIKIYLMGEITSGWLPPVRYAPAIKAMDAVNLNNWSTDGYDRSVFFASYCDMNWKNWTDSTTSWNIDFTPVIFPGFNDKAMTPASKLFNLGGNKEFYTNFSNVAKRNMSKNRIVLINSWNNFQMGTSIEPTVEYGKLFLETTKTEFKIN
jgi:hypothetical protein